MSNKEMLALYSINCLKCSHLVETATFAFVKCHYSKGNLNCPALELSIVIVGKADVYAKRVLKARLEKDIKVEAALLTTVSKESVAFQAKFQEALEANIENK
jgi:hypothetical protein